jgi:predicted RNA-binding Zn-ribbon protein involved in translation (DUF1610 family)
MALVPINFDLLYEDLCEVVHCLARLASGIPADDLAAMQENLELPKEEWPSLEGLLAALDEEVWEEHSVALRRIDAQLNGGEIDLIEAGYFRRALLSQIYDSIGRLPREQPKHTPEGREEFATAIRQPLSIIREMKEIFNPDISDQEAAELAGELLQKPPRAKAPPCPDCGGKTVTQSSPKGIRKFKCQNCGHNFQRAKST